MVLKSPFVLRSNTKHINVLYAQNVEFLEVTPGGAQSNLYSLKDYTKINIWQTDAYNGIS